MKTLALSLFLLTSTLAHAEKINAFESIINVECKSIFERNETTRISATRRQNAEGFTKAMTLTVDRLIRNDWYKQKFFMRTATYNTEDKSVEIKGVNRHNEKLFLTIYNGEDSMDADGFAYSELKINNRMEDYLKFVCKVNLGD